LKCSSDACDEMCLSVYKSCLNFYYSLKENDLCFHSPAKLSCSCCSDLVPLHLSSPSDTQEAPMYVCLIVFLHSQGKHLPSTHTATCRESGESDTSPCTGFKVSENCQGICRKQLQLIPVTLNGSWKHSLYPKPVFIYLLGKRVLMKEDATGALAFFQTSVRLLHHWLGWVPRSRC